MLPESRRGDPLASLGVARLGRVDDAARVHEERVVTDGLDRVTEHRIDAGALLYAGIHARERVHLGAQITGRRHRIYFRLELGCVEVQDLCHGFDRRSLWFELLQRAVRFGVAADEARRHRNEGRPHRPCP